MATGLVRSDPLLLAGLVAIFGLPYLGFAYWVYRNASRRGSDRAAWWGVGMLLLGPFFQFGFGYYYLVRGRIGPSVERPTRGDYLVRNLLLASLLIFLAGALGPPDPITQIYYAVYALPFAVALAVVVTYRDVLTSAI